VMWVLNGACDEEIGTDTEMVCMKIFGMVITIRRLT
jgi:hypothetical protein